MSVPRNPVAAAAKVKTLGQAARLNDDLETELSLGTDLDPGWEAQAEQARDDLAGRFGGFDALHNATQGKQPKAVRVGNTMVKPQHGGRQRSGPPKPAPKASSGAGRRAPVKPAPRTARRSGSVWSRGGSARRVADVTGATELAGSTTDLAIGALRVGLVLALAYLLLSPRGTWGLTHILNGVSAAVNLLIAPVDPLKGTAKPAGVAGYQSYDAAVAAGAVAGPAVPGDVAGTSPRSASGALGVPNIGGFPQTVRGARRPAAVPHPNTP